MRDGVRMTQKCIVGHKKGFKSRLVHLEKELWKGKKNFIISFRKWTEVSESLRVEMRVCMRLKWNVSRDSWVSVPEN